MRLIGLVLGLELLSVFNTDYIVSLIFNLLAQVLDLGRVLLFHFFHLVKSLCPDIKHLRVNILIVRGELLRKL